MNGVVTFCFEDQCIGTLRVGQIINHYIYCIRACLKIHCPNLNAPLCVPIRVSRNSCPFRLADFVRYVYPSGYPVTHALSGWRTSSDMYTHPGIP